MINVLVKIKKSLFYYLFDHVFFLPMHRARCESEAGCKGKAADKTECVLPLHSAST